MQAGNLATVTPMIRTLQASHDSHRGPYLGGAKVPKMLRISQELFLNPVLHTSTVKVKKHLLGITWQGFRVCGFGVQGLGPQGSGFRV